jgi:hypothetical protein
LQVNETGAWFPKKYAGIASKQISEHVGSVFFEVEDKELNGDKTYELHVLVVADTDDKDICGKIENAYITAFSAEGIRLQLPVVTEEDVTLAVCPLISGNGSFNSSSHRMICWLTFSIFCSASFSLILHSRMMHTRQQLSLYVCNRCLSV